MAKRRGATTRDPKMRAQPVRKGGAEQVARGGGDIRQGTKTSGQLKRAVNKAANRAPMQRLSPGVYRSAGGGLVTQKGRPIQRQAQPGIPPESAGNPWAQGGQIGEQLGGSTLSPEERLAQGIDPRDPNIYTRGPGGEVYGTLIGWSSNQPTADQLSSLTGMRTPEGQMGQQMPMDKMYRWPQAPQMPQPSANMGGQYRLSPGVYGTREQAMNQYNQQMQQMQQMRQPAMPMRRG